MLLSTDQEMLRVCQIYEGTSDVQKIIIQRALA
jgi:alkylation response protein AidB-like acyl-CoA dehydrogenase